MMITVALIISAALTPAQQPAFNADTVYEIYLNRSGSDQTLYGRMRTVADGQVEVDPDEPWNPGRRKLFVRSADIIDYHPEDPERQAKRLAKGWDDAGYTPVDGMWVRKDDAVLAERSASMAQTAAAKQQPQTAPSVAAPAAESAPAPVGFWPQWGGHIAVVSVSILLTGLVLYTLVLR